ncbi:DUF2460 domain-containing protein [Polycladidibacter stylochi]|uniref:DUF2460 domain-containing protein n=1 Tax=Polycladidibacter stylochi TaxID=1807766 RepID=UPI00083608AE|nr:DUF2460 domain-containing protein [Pseudovibrio stylochi]
MSFLQQRFPLQIAFGMSGGPQWQTQIATMTNGKEARNGTWSQARRRYDAASGVRSLADLQQLFVLFAAAKGRLNGFRFQDPFDYCSCVLPGPPTPQDCLQAFATGSLESRYQLVKVYRPSTMQSESAQEALETESQWNQWGKRAITRPHQDSLLIAIEGVALPSNTYSLDVASGQFYFLQGSVPAKGARITAGFTFDTPVRFDSDTLEVTMESFEAGQLPTIPLIEIIEAELPQIDWSSP